MASSTTLRRSHIVHHHSSGQIRVCSASGNRFSGCRVTRMRRSRPTAGIGRGNDNVSKGGRERCNWSGRCRSVAVVVVGICHIGVKNHTGNTMFVSLGRRKRSRLGRCGWSTIACTRDGVHTLGRNPLSDILKHLFTSQVRSRCGNSRRRGRRLNGSRKTFTLSPFLECSLVFLP